MLQTTVEMAASISKMLHIYIARKMDRTGNPKRKYPKPEKNTHFLFFHVYIINVKIISNQNGDIIRIY
jgi:hypothetical protein